MTTEMIVEKLLEIADRYDAEARDARDAGNAELARQLFEYRDALDRAANLLQRG